jgi:hypothetical protein
MLLLSSYLVREVSRTRTSGRTTQLRRENLAVAKRHISREGSAARTTQPPRSSLVVQLAPLEAEIEAFDVQHTQKFHLSLFLHDLYFSFTPYENFGLQTQAGRPFDARQFAVGM